MGGALPCRLRVLEYFFRLRPRESFVCRGTSDFGYGHCGGIALLSVGGVNSLFHFSALFAGRRILPVCRVWACEEAVDVELRCERLAGLEVCQGDRGGEFRGQEDDGMLSGCARDGFYSREIDVSVITWIRQHHRTRFFPTKLTGSSNHPSLDPWPRHTSLQAP